MSEDTPSDQYEDLVKAERELKLGNTHTAVQILIDVVRGLL